MTALPYSNTYLTRAELAQIVAIARAEQHSARMKLAVQRETADADDDGFEYRVRKMLWDISRHPNTAAMLGKAQAYYARLHEQRRPADISPAEWEQQRVTPNRVLRYLRDIMKKMNTPRFNDELRLVRTKGGLEFRAYGVKSRRTLKALRKTVWSNAELLAGEFPQGGASVAHEGYARHYRRKAQALALQTTPFEDVQPRPDVCEFLAVTKFVSPLRTLELTTVQRTDAERVFSKDYAILNWQQGSGKTVVGMYYIEFMRKLRKRENMIVLSSPKAIRQTWTAHLQEFGLPFVVIESMNDFANVPVGAVVLLRYTKLGSGKIRRYARKAIRGFVKQRKCALLVDESHHLGNHASKRTRKALALFRHMRYKLLMTGTATRNNVLELYPQMELLYNNSVAMTCYAERKYRREDDEIVEEKNEIYGRPFPAFHGARYWKACFAPSRTSVFGIERNGQDVYNAEELRRLLSSTVLTRTFNEIVGPGRYEYHTHTFSQNEAERALYAEIMQEFYRMIPMYFQSHGFRKDAYLRIIRQINLLIRAASMPHKFREWSGEGLPTKMKKILRHVERHHERIMLGVLKHEALCEYEKELQPLGRPVFVVSGKMLFAKRIAAIAAFQDTADGILLCTQQSLNESVNISHCNHVIAESLPWNISALEQFVFRCIRFDSTAKTHVHLFYYAGSLEPNLMALLLAKEKINTFVRRRDFVEEEELLATYNVDANLLQHMIEKARNREGQMELRWGVQEVVV